MNRDCIFFRQHAASAQPVYRDIPDPGNHSTDSKPRTTCLVIRINFISQRYIRAAAGAAIVFVALASHAAERFVLTVPRVAAFTSMDPPQAFDLVSDQVQRQVYSTLLTYAYLERPYKLEPELLESLPTWSADKLTYTFHLRKGVRFHDNASFPGGKGREMTTDDVLYSLKRYADARLNSKSWFAMEGAVLGLDAYRSATARAKPDADLTNSDVPGLRRIDAYTFTIQLTRENPLFLYSLTMLPTAIVPVEAVHAYGEHFDINPVGTGPFSLRGPVDRQATLHFISNPNYYGIYPNNGTPDDSRNGRLNDAGKKLPLVGAVDMPLVTEPQKASQMFLRGELDVHGLDGTNFSKAVVRTMDGGFRLSGELATRFDVEWSGGTDTTFITLNLKDPLIGSNRLLRRALAHALDPQAIINVLYDGRQRRLGSLVPYDLPGSERETGGVASQHDPIRAKQLLADAGYPEGRGLPPITIDFQRDNVNTRSLFELLRAQFAAVGIHLHGRFQTPSSAADARGSSDFQLKYNGWSADYPDPENFFQLLYSKNIAPGPNAGSYINPAYDRAYEAMRLMPNGPSRLESIRKMNSLIQEDVPILLLDEKLEFAVLQKRVRNFERGLIPYQYMYVRLDRETGL